MKFKLIIITFIFIAIQGCRVGTNKTWENENIKPSIKAEIKKLNDKVIMATLTNNPQMIKELMAEKLLEISGDDFEDLLSQVNSFIIDRSYYILDEYYVKNTTTGVSNTVFSGSGNKDYILSYLALNKNMYVSLLSSENNEDEMLTTVIYGKYPEGWKINIINFGQYKIGGKTAPELYEKAKFEYSEGFLIDAANTSFLLSQALKPSSENWQYQNELEMEDFIKNIIAETKVKYQFPIMLDQIITKPEIFNFFPMRVAEGYFPMIEYVTTIDLTDTVATKNENEEMHKIIGRIFFGIDKDKDFLFYKAYNELPNGVTLVPTYGFVKKL